MQLLDRIQTARAQAQSGALTLSALDLLLADMEIHLTTSIDNALATLSYSEEEALQAIIPELNAAEGGLLVASRIADQAGITRSVIVNVLRKLESAGVIQAHSLGQKGTHIKTLIPGWSARVRQRKVA